MTAAEAGIGILCVDDNRQVADALRIQLVRHGYVWKGWLPSADGLVEAASRDCPDVVLLDLDMPGHDPFDATAGLVRSCPGSRVVIYSGHVTAELIARALDAGAWGYVSKNDGAAELFTALTNVMGQEVAFSPEVRAVYDRG